MKQNETLLTIGEVAKIMGITRRIIINYEEQGLIFADTRGEFGKGYRYYSMDTLVRIRTIRAYQELGLSLGEIKNYLDDNTDLEPAIERLEALRQQLDLNIERLRERVNKSGNQEIVITELPQCSVYSKTLKNSDIETKTNQMRDIAYMAMSSHGADVSGRMYFTRYPLYDSENITYCAIVPFGTKGGNIEKLSKVKAIAKYHHGRYETILETRDELVRFAKENRIDLSGECRHIYLEGPPQHKNPENYITMIALLLSE